MKYFIYSIIAIVTASIIAGFFIVGSPQEERLRRFDERRVSDLQQLQSAVINYYLAKDTLPQNFIELSANASIPRDPETNMLYEYIITNKETFSLCATFALPSLPENGSYPIPKSPYGTIDETNWDHGTGHACFPKKIDKDFYLPSKTTRP